MFLKAAKEVLGHDLFHVKNNIVHLDKTGEPVSDEIQREIEKLSEPSLDDRKLEALLSLDQRHAEILRNLTGDASIEERDTWQAKALAAEAVQTGNAKPYQLDVITTEAEMSGIEVSDLVTTILAKNDAFMKMIGIAAGFRKATRMAINSAPDVSTLELILAQAETDSENLINDFLQGSDQ